MAIDSSLKRIWKYLLVLALIIMAGIAVYYGVQSIFYPNRVKVTVLNRQTNKPVTSHQFTLREVCSAGTECEHKTLLTAKTNIFGKFTTTTKQLTDSFEVVADGYKTDGPWLKRPASLFFSRQYSDSDFYSTNISQTDLVIKVEPAN